MYNPQICRLAMEAEKRHTDSVIAMDNNPDRDSFSGRLPFCDCHRCRPEKWPSDIENQLDEYMEENGPGTVSVDE